MISIKKHIVDQIIKHAKKVYPIEACGYLAGIDNTITHFFEMTNIDNSEEHFSFDPTEQFVTIKKTREIGVEILANYHSHPQTPARPSEEDIKLAFDSNILYFIISLKDEIADVKAFRIVSSKVELVTLNVIE